MRLKLGISCFTLLCITVTHAQKGALVAVQSPKDSVILFDLQSGKKKGQIKVGFLPHEVTYDPVSRKCFISNFGLYDYDIHRGRPGSSLSVIDPWRMKYIATIYTASDTAKGNGPHGIKVRPGKKQELYVNVEINGDSMLVYDTETFRLKRKFPLPKSSHNFVFSNDGLKLWVMAAGEGVYELNPETGNMLHRQTFSSPIRGLALGKNWIVASGKNEVFLLSKDDLHVIKQFSNLGVGQILYSNITPDQKILLCPAVSENVLLIIDVKTGKVMHKLATYKAPINVQIRGNTAYVSHDEDDFITAINLKTFTTSLAMPVYGTNGLIIIQE